MRELGYLIRAAGEGVVNAQTSSLPLGGLLTIVVRGSIPK